MPSLNKVDKWLFKNGYNLKGYGSGKPKKKRKKKKSDWGKVKAKIRMKKSAPLIEKRKTADRSPAEKQIELFLMQNNIRFIPEYFTKYCYSHKSNHLLFFDFWLPNHNVAIEFDGLHHYKPIHGIEKLKEQKYKDRVKDRYCRRRGIRLLRISCFDSKRIEELICKFFDLIES